jgi:hypothetical protein
VGRTVGADLVSAQRLLKTKNEERKTIFRLLNKITTKKERNRENLLFPVPFLSVYLLIYVKC